MLQTVSLSLDGTSQIGKNALGFSLSETPETQSNFDSIISEINAKADGAYKENLKLITNTENDISELKRPEDDEAAKIAAVLTEEQVNDLLAEVEGLLKGETKLSHEVDGNIEASNTNQSISDKLSLLNEDELVAFANWLQGLSEEKENLSGRQITGFNGIDNSEQTDKISKNEIIADTVNNQKSASDKDSINIELSLKAKNDLKLSDQQDEFNQNVNDEGHKSSLNNLSDLIDDTGKEAILMLADVQKNKAEAESNIDKMEKEQIALNAAQMQKTELKTSNEIDNKQSIENNSTLAKAFDKLGLTQRVAATDDSEIKTVDSSEAEIELTKGIVDDATVKTQLKQQIEVATSRNIKEINPTVSVNDTNNIEGVSPSVIDKERTKIEMSVPVAESAAVTATKNAVKTESSADVKQNSQLELIKSSAASAGEVDVDAGNQNKEGSSESERQNTHLLHSQTNIGLSNETSNINFARQLDAAASGRLNAEAKDLAAIMPKVDLSQVKQASQQIKQEVSLMVNRGLSQVEIRLDPAELGSMHIKLNVNQEQANVQIHVQNPQAKELLEQTLPRLKEMLAQQGITLGESSIHQEAKQQSGGNSEAEQGGIVTAGQQSVNVESESESRSMTLDYSSDSGIDYYA